MAAAWGRLCLLQEDHGLPRAVTAPALRSCGSGALLGAGGEDVGDNPLLEAAPREGTEEEFGASLSSSKTPGSSSTGHGAEAAFALASGASLGIAHHQSPAARSSPLQRSPSSLFSLGSPSKCDLCL